MRLFTDGDEIWIEPWRSRAFPVVRDLVVDRGAFDRIIAAGGFIGVRTGGAPDANAIPVPKQSADAAMDAAACIGCGACVAACPNGSASLFTAAKVSHLGLLPQGQPERHRRALRMVVQMDLESFGGCTLFGECQAACPKDISIDIIARMHRDYLRRRSADGLAFSRRRLRRGVYNFGSVTPRCAWYFPPLSLYDTSGSSSPRKNSTCAIPSFA